MIVSIILKICVAYLDDILIYGKNFDEHCVNVKKVLNCLKSKGIKLNGKNVTYSKPKYVIWVDYSLKTDIVQTQKILWL